MTTNSKRLFVDNREFAKSTSHLSSRANRVIFCLPSGFQAFRIVGHINYQRVWDKSLKTKEYTLASKFVRVLELRSPTEIEPEFRLAIGTLTQGFVGKNKSVVKVNRYPSGAYVY